MGGLRSKVLLRINSLSEIQIESIIGAMEKANTQREKVKNETGKIVLNEVKLGKVMKKAKIRINIVHDIHKEEEKDRALEAGEFESILKEIDNL